MIRKLTDSLDIPRGVVVIVIKLLPLLLLAAPSGAAEPPGAALHIRCRPLARPPCCRRCPLTRLLRLPPCRPGRLLCCRCLLLSWGDKIGEAPPAGCR